MKFIPVSALISVGFLSACGLSEKQCVQGDWFAIGTADGLNGQSDAYIQNHIKSCGKHGITPNQSQWEQGRKRGLQTYCTPQSAYLNGRNGKGLKNVCPVGDLESLQLAHDKGALYYRYDQDIRDLEREKSRIRGEIHDLYGQPDSPEKATRIGHLRNRIFRINMRINHSRLERQRYAQL